MPDVGEYGTEIVPIEDHILGDFSTCANKHDGAKGAFVTQAGYSANLVIDVV